MAAVWCNWLQAFATSACNPDPYTVHSLSVAADSRKEAVGDLRVPFVGLYFFGPPPEQNKFFAPA